MFATLVPAAHAVGARFHLANPYGAPAALFAKLQLLFDALGLADYFSAEAADELGGLAPVLAARWQQAGNEGVIEHAEAESTRAVARYGINSWPAALSAALAAEKDFSTPQYDGLVRGPIIL